MHAVLMLSLLMLGADVDDERAQVEERLKAEKESFDALTNEKTSLSVALKVLQQLTLESSARAKAIDKTLFALDARADQLRREAAATEDEMNQLRERLKPRLFTLYRFRSLRGLGALLSSENFAGLLKRQRGLAAMVDADARALEELEQLVRYQRVAARRVETLEASSRAYLRALRTEQALSRGRLARFSELLENIGAEANQKSRSIAEMEHAQKELERLNDDLSAASASTGFRSLKGRLPFPTKGLVEVGFGRVVNPRFNTVTQQKGLDIRATLGTPVLCVGKGTVVYVGWLKGYGNIVIVDHGGDYHSLYAHLANSDVDEGTELEEGEAFAQVGDTGSLKGSFLYFEIRKGGLAIDPRPWLSAEE